MRVAMTYDTVMCLSYASGMCCSCEFPIWSSSFFYNFLLQYTHREFFLWLFFMTNFILMTDDLVMCLSCASGMRWSYEFLIRISSSIWWSSPCPILYLPFDDHHPLQYTHREILWLMTRLCVWVMRFKLWFNIWWIL